MNRRLFATALLVLFSTSASSADAPEVVELLATIKGKEKRPAGEVFNNVKLLKDVPAASLLRIMDSGYARALGVHCDHCHVEGRYESDDKRSKRAARAMIALTGMINDELAGMPEIDNQEPAVNCTTCHRGYLEPALQMR